VSKVVLVYERYWDGIIPFDQSDKVRFRIPLQFVALTLNGLCQLR
ncbi:unnamed protein product, partial [Acidithrix sp. C25]